MLSYNAVHDRGWTKVQTQGKPTKDECAALRKVGLSFSPKVGWYIPHLFDLARLEQLLDRYLPKNGNGSQPEPHGPADDPVMEVKPEEIIPDVVIEDHLGRIVKGDNGNEPEEVGPYIKPGEVSTIIRIEVERSHNGNPYKGKHFATFVRPQGAYVYRMTEARAERLQAALRNFGIKGVDLKSWWANPRDILSMKSSFLIGVKSRPAPKKITRKAAKHKLLFGTANSGPRWTNPVKGYVVPDTPGLFIHRPTVRDENLVDGWKSDTSSKVWCVTHIKSGYSIWAKLSTLERLDDAVKFVHELGKVNIDWTLDGEQVLHDVQAEGVKTTEIYDKLFLN